MGNLTKKDALTLFHTIFDKATQWEIAEVENEHIPIDKIDRYDDWTSYGNYQNKAAKIFNDMKTGWKVVKTFDDLDTDDYDEITVDYFDDKHDYDEYNIDIREVK